MPVQRWRLANVALVAAIGSIALGWASSAQAQINPFLGYRGPTLSKEDLDTGAAAAVRLLNDERAAVGQFEPWVGAKSGNQGTMMLQRIFERSGMPCRSIVARIIYKGRPNPREFTLVACRISTGEWKLAN